MALRVDVFVISVEFLLVVYILLDVYGAIFVHSNDVVSPEDRFVALNSSNKVLGIGKFAVDEYNKLSESNLRFEEVVRALYAQSSYMLLVQATDGKSFSDSKQIYAAAVREQGARMALVAFEEYMDSYI